MLSSPNPVHTTKLLSSFILGRVPGRHGQQGDAGTLGAPCPCCGSCRGTLACTRRVQHEQRRLHDVPARGGRNDGPDAGAVGGVLHDPREGGPQVPLLLQELTMAQPLQHRPQASHGAAGQMWTHHATRLLAAWTHAVLQPGGIYDLMSRVYAPLLTVVLCVGNGWCVKNFVRVVLLVYHCMHTALPRLLYCEDLFFLYFLRCPIVVEAKVLNFQPVKKSRD